MRRLFTRLRSFLVCAAAGSAFAAGAQTTNPAPYCQYNAGITVQGYSGAISKVTLGTLNHATAFGNLPTAYNSTTGACTQLYTYYNNVAAPSLAIGSSQTISLEFKSYYDGEPVWYAAFIDFNHDNAFDSTTEMVIDQAHANIPGFIPSSNSISIITATRSNTFVVPATAVPGTTRMRVIRGQRVMGWQDSVSRLNPCQSYIYPTLNKWMFGEVEDYNVVLIQPGPVPALSTLSAVTVTSSSAVLKGMVNANGGNVSVFFEYGTSTAYGNSVAATPSTVAGNNNIPVSATKTGLMPNTLYHYRIRAVGGVDTFYSADSTFHTYALGAAGVAAAPAEISMYPNPSTGSLTIEAPGLAGPLVFSVYDAVGARVLSGQTTGGGRETISLAALPAGVYQLLVVSGEQVARKTVQLVR